MKFKVALYPSEDGYGVNVPGLPGCWSQGATEEEALANIAEAIREYLKADIDSTDEAIIREIEVASTTLAHRIEAALSEDGKLLIDHLPFRAGQKVEVIVLPVIRAMAPSPALRGTVLRYDQPTAPAAEADWGALQ